MQDIEPETFQPACLVEQRGPRLDRVDADGKAKALVNQ
jgi:hypothetical protein